MTKIISVAMQKGGIGKTTTAYNLAANLQHMGKNVLLIDMDSQANATFNAGINSADLDDSLYNLLTDDQRYSCNARDVILKTDFFDIVPADRDVADLVNELSDPERLKNKLNLVVDLYDYIIIDCPPALNILTVNAFVASDYIIVPTEARPFSFTGLRDLSETVSDVRRSWNKTLKVLGIVLIKFHERTNLNKQMRALIDAESSALNTDCFSTTIRESIVVPESQIAQQPLHIYDKKSKPSQDYMDLTQEIITRIE